MRVERFTTVQDFLARTMPFLVAREAEHNLLLGLSSRLLEDPRMYGADPYLAAVEEGSHVVAVALRTPPHNLILSELDDPAACDLVAADVRSETEDLRGVLGPVPAVQRFVDVWRELTGTQAGDRRRQRIYQVERVVAPPRAPGKMRAYRDDDRDLCVAWIDAFVEEALAESPPPGDSETMLDHRLADPDGGIVFWEDDNPVSLAGFGGATPSGIRIGPVYTPPHLRGRGYASNLVGELTRTLLAGGRRFCFLFTDLANPTSNGVYLRIGYEPVTDVHEVLFEPA